MGIFIFICILIILFIVIRIISKRNAISVSENDWERITNNPETETLFLQEYNVSNFNDIVNEILRPLHIQYIQFMSNFMWLHLQGQMNNLNPEDKMFFSFQSPSIKYWTRKIDRPKIYPIWFIAAFPDLILWTLNDSISDEEIENRWDSLLENLSENEINKLSDSQWGTKESIKIINKLLQNYLKKVNSTFETQRIP